ncbi:hypothetical protein RvY_06801 [Ramazzottius varieornatus]|uniref:Uncharacterized protein n=1 Tax=Ramazzottius varieornatus TaxID=947166 RepID=A0A1D1UZV2_RAMVA|nr:hypothetical protein RvY_06801 [Ramazzottius varieornatus]
MDSGYLSVLWSMLSLTLVITSRAQVTSLPTTQQPSSTTTTTVAAEILPVASMAKTLESRRALALLANFLAAQITSQVQARQISMNNVARQVPVSYSYPYSHAGYGNYGYNGFSGQPTNGNPANGIGYNGYNLYYSNGLTQANYAVNGYGNSGYGNGYYGPSYPTPSPVDPPVLDPNVNDELERSMAVLNSIEDSLPHATRFNPFPVISQPKQSSQMQGGMDQNRFPQRQVVTPGIPVRGSPLTGSYGYASLSGGSAYG